MSVSISSRICVQRLALGSSRPARAARPRSLRVNALSLPQDYGYVMTSVALTAAMTQWQAIRVAIARREYGIQYPKMYADGDDEAAMKFNCSQRAHQNTLETLPSALALQILLGLAYPKVAAGLGLAWTAGRVVYTLGYSTGDPSKRLPGGASSGLAYVALILATAATGVKTAAGL